MEIKRSGIYDMPNDVYHSDPCPQPSASRSFLQTLVARSPSHAAIEHPRLNPDYVPDDKTAFDFGSAAHDYFLEGGNKVCVLDFVDYRKKEAQEARDEALRQNKYPILVGKFQDVKVMAEAAWQQIKTHADYPTAFTNGKPEQSIIWEEDGLWFRARPDYLTNDGWLDDYKTTGVGGPDAWMHGTFFDKGYDLQAYMGLRGYKTVTGKKPKGFRFWVQETEAPFNLYCVVPSDLTLETAQQKFLHAKELFGTCLRANRWPGYSNHAYVVEPNFKANKGYEDIKIFQEKAIRADGDIFQVLHDWQKPFEQRTQA